MKKLLLLALFLAACNGTPTPTEVPPTDTPTPSDTPTPTPSNTPTPTPSDTPTPTPSNTPTVPTDTPTPEPQASDWTVGPGGDWAELDQIDWGSVANGDTILILAGQYETPMEITKGVSIIVSGPVVLFGGRDTPLPYCGQSDWSGSTPVANNGIKVKADNVTIDGGDWSGITIHGWGRHGMSISNSVDNLLVRNVEIYDNGNIRPDGDPDQEGVNVHGNNITFERVIIHDNGQDAFQSGDGLSNFTLRESWLYNTREHPNQPGEAFNECRHADGIQIFGDGTMSGVTIEDSVIGPGFMQGVLLGGNAAHIQVTVNDVVMRDVLFMKNTNANIHSHSPPVDPKNWTLERVTAVRKDAPNDGSEGWWNVFVEGTGHTVVDSVFYGGRANGFIDQDPQVSGNCRFKVSGTNLGPTVNPQFTNFDENDMFSLDDFTIQNPDCVGSSITSVDNLLSR